MMPSPTASRVTESPLGDARVEEAPVPAPPALLAAHDLPAFEPTRRVDARVLTRNLDAEEADEAYRGPQLVRVDNQGGETDLIHTDGCLELTADDDDDSWLD